MTHPDQDAAGWMEGLKVEYKKPANEIWPSAPWRVHVGKEFVADVWNEPLARAIELLPEMVKKLQEVGDVKLDDEEWWADLDVLLARLQGKEAE